MNVSRMIKRAEVAFQEYDRVTISEEVLVHSRIEDDDKEFLSGYGLPVIDAYGLTFEVARKLPKLKGLHRFGDSEEFEGLITLNIDCDFICGVCSLGHVLALGETDGKQSGKYLSKNIRTLVMLFALIQDHGDRVEAGEDLSRSTNKLWADFREFDSETVDSLWWKAIVEDVNLWL